MMGKYRFGWPDLLLLLGLVPALTGHFYTAMAVLAAYAVLYYRATRRRPCHFCQVEYSRPACPDAEPYRLTRADVGRLYDIPDGMMRDLPMPPR